MEAQTLAQAWASVEASVEELGPKLAQVILPRTLAVSAKPCRKICASVAGQSCSYAFNTGVLSKSYRLRYPACSTAISIFAMRCIGSRAEPDVLVLQVAQHSQGASPTQIKEVLKGNHLVPAVPALALSCSGSRRQFFLLLKYSLQPQDIVLRSARVCRSGSADQGTLCGRPQSLSSSPGPTGAARRISGNARSYRLDLTIAAVSLLPQQSDRQYQVFGLATASFSRNFAPVKGESFSVELKILQPVPPLAFSARRAARSHSSAVCFVKASNCRRPSLQT